MKILWVIKLVPRMVSLLKKTVGLFLDNPVTKRQESDMVGSGCGP